MKTKIASLCLAAVFSILAFATNTSAAEEGFYDKEHIRGFISLGGDFRGMFPAFQDYVNTVPFASGALKHKYDTDTSVYYGYAKYSKFNKYYTGFTSEFPLYDARWFSYGVDWMFGWKTLGEDAFFNLIPAVGIGFNMMNIHFTSNYVVTKESSDEEAIMRDRYYSTMAATFNVELEARLQFEQFSIGLYGGYRAVRYNELNVEGANLDTTIFNTDNDGDTWFIGLRLGWTFLSPWEKKQLDKI